MHDITDKTKTKDFCLVDLTTGEVPGKVKLEIVQEKKGLYPGYFTSFHQDRHLIKALADGPLRLSCYLKSIMSKGNWIKVTNARLSTELRISGRSIIAWMNELKRLDVIRGRHGTYMYNPRIAINGGSKVLKMALHNYEMLSDKYQEGL